MTNRILLVRLGALGDIIHALPVAAGLRRAFPAARIDWLVSARHREILDYVPVVDRRVVLERAGKRPAAASGAVTAWRGVARAIGELREADYDVAFDLQGLLKSAILARSSGARRVIGFSVRHVRERWAHLFYTEAVEPPTSVHVVDKNLALLAAVGLHDLPREFPIVASGGALRLTDDTGGPARSGQAGEAGAAGGAGGAGEPRFALLNPGAGWPNKRWPPERFGAIADHLQRVHGLPSVVLWGPGEDDLARSVVGASAGAARLAPPTDIGAMIALARAASLFVSGDTGPLHIAAAVGTPIVGVYGPTSPARNGPWDPADICVSRFDDCICHHRRRCRRETCCLLDIRVDDVRAAIDRRLGGPGVSRGPQSRLRRSEWDAGQSPGTENHGPAPEPRDGRPRTTLL